MDIHNILTLRYDPIPSSKEIETQLRTIIRQTLTDKKQISLALSTGVDSNLMLSLIRDEFPNLNIKCITISFDDTSEDPSEIARKHNADFLKVVIDNPLKDLPLLIKIVQEPRWNLYQYYVIEKATDILVTGDGGDELFGGYTFRYKKFLELLDKDDDWKQRVIKYLQCHERDWVPDQDEMLPNFKWDSIYSLLRKYFDNNLDPLDQVFLADYNGKLLHDFIPTNNKFYNHFGITGFSPLLDPNIIDMSFLIPPYAKYNGTGKLPLREILNRLGVKVSNNKIGFGMDLVKLWKSHGKEMVTSSLNNVFKIINKDWYNRSIKRIDETQDVRYISKMLQLLSLEIWYKV